MKPLYNVIVPRLDKTGPVMLAHDVAKTAHEAGYKVKFYYLNGSYSKSDLDFDAEVEKLSLKSALKLKGIVHTHSFRPDLVGALLSFSSKRATITTIPSYFLADVSFDYPRWKALAAWHTWRFALRFFDRRVCISKSMIRYYSKKAPGLECDFIYNSRLPLPGDDRAPSSELSAWADDQRHAGRVVLVYAGGLRPRKNVAKLVEHCAGLDDVALLVLGGGPLEGDLKTIVERAGAGNRIVFGGFVPRAREYMAVANALVLPSFAEGLANVILEAASVGIPSLMSNLAVHRELAALGLGVVFDHKRFSDFDRATRLIAERFAGKDAKDEVRRLWQTRFSGTASFAEYDAIFEAIAPKSAGPA